MHEIINPDTFMQLVNEVNTFGESILAKIEDFSSSATKEDLIRSTKNILLGKIENLRNTGTNEQFAEFERRLTLASIDELWMQHIDRMAHLREEVAFE
jgi:preprotein translocase subunit SecA